MFTILGASGFIGQHLVTNLREQGVDVCTPMPGDNCIFSESLGHVIYCIGVTADFRTRPYDTVRAHVGVLADVLEKSDFDSLLYLSSTRVYARTPLGQELVPLSLDVADPMELYSFSKLTGESLCRNSGRNGVRVARISNVVGFDPQVGQFLSGLVRDALTGHIQLHSDLASSKDYILIGDVVKILPAISLYGRDWLYNVASGKNIHHHAIVECLAALTSCTWTVSPDAPLTCFPQIDIERIKAEFDFSPTSVLDALPGLVEAFRSSQLSH